MKKWRAAALIGLSLWILGFIATPLIDAASPAAGRFLYGIFSRTCHQIPERSFWLAGSPLGVCIRCTAIYTAGWLLIMVSLCMKQIRLFPGYVYLILALPMIVDFVFEKFNLYQDLMSLRLLTGALFGFALFHLFIVSIQSQTVYDRQKKDYRWKTSEL